MAGIGFFAPLPLAIMIPFMAAQSAAMAQAFGTYYQYGKRKISSLTNEEFNRLTPEKLFSDIQGDVRAMIPHMASAMTAVGPLQDKIISELVAIIPRVPGAVEEGLKDVNILDSVLSLANLGGSASNKMIQDLAASILKGIPEAEARRGDTQTTGNQYLIDQVKLLQARLDAAEVSPTDTTPPTVHVSTDTNKGVRTFTNLAFDPTNPEHTAKGAGATKTISVPLNKSSPIAKLSTQVKKNLGQLEQQEIIIKRLLQSARSTGGTNRTRASNSYATMLRDVQAKISAMKKKHNVPTNQRVTPPNAHVSKSRSGKIRVTVTPPSVLAAAQRESAAQLVARKKRKGRRG